MKVDFLILGSQKGGSTWLYNMLRRHPLINTPSHELHFFSKDENYAKGVDWYHSHFPVKEGATLVGEKTPEYLTVIPSKNKKTSTETCRRIYDYNNDIKLLVVLREPVARLRSAINHMYRTRRIPPWVSAHDLILGGRRQAAEEFSLLENGIYYDNLMEYYKIFPKSRIMVMYFETDILKQPEQTLRNVCSFLEVPFEKEYFAALDRKQNEYQMSLPAIALNYFLPFLRPLNNRLNHIFPAYKTRLDAETDNFLKLYYATSNKRLEELAGPLPESWKY